MSEIIKLKYQIDAAKEIEGLFETDIKYGLNADELKVVYVIRKYQFEKYNQLIQLLEKELENV